MILRGLEPGDAGWVLEQHGRHYAKSDGFGVDFEAFVARLLADFLDSRDPRAFRGWIAEDASGARVGCVFMDRVDAQANRLRMFYVVPEARGQGVAQALLDAVIAQARYDGRRFLRIWTHESHREAGRLYARNGFSLMDSKPVLSFGRPMVEQWWQKQISPG